jgi:hypothetical protein
MLFYFGKIGIYIWAITFSILLCVDDTFLPYGRHVRYFSQTLIWTRHLPTLFTLTSHLPYLACPALRACIFAFPFKYIVAACTYKAFECRFWWSNLVLVCILRIFSEIANVIYLWAIPCASASVADVAIFIEDTKSILWKTRYALDGRPQRDLNSEIVQILLVLSLASF